jgi:hypothetical protein
MIDFYFLNIKLLINVYKFVLMVIIIFIVMTHKFLDQHSIFSVYPRVLKIFEEIDWWIVIFRYQIFYFSGAVFLHLSL